MILTPNCETCRKNELSQSVRTHITRHNTRKYSSAAGRKIGSNRTRWFMVSDVNATMLQTMVSQWGSGHITQRDGRNVPRGGICIDSSCVNLDGSWMRGCYRERGPRQSLQEAGQGRKLETYRTKCQGYIAGLSIIIRASVYLCQAMHYQ